MPRTFLIHMVEVEEEEEGRGKAWKSEKWYFQRIRSYDIYIYIYVTEQHLNQVNPIPREILYLKPISKCYQGNYKFYPESIQSHTLISPALPSSLYHLSGHVLYSIHVHLQWLTIGFNYLTSMLFNTRFTGHIIWTHFEFLEENYTSRLQFSFSIFTDFYPFNETNICRNSFSSKLSMW